MTPSAALNLTSSAGRSPSCLNRDRSLRARSASSRRESVLSADLPSRPVSRGWRRKAASALASAEAVSHQAIAAILTVLETRGYIQRSPDPTDGRRQLVSLTDAGVAQAEHATSAREEWLARALQDRLTEDERRTVRHAMALLNRLAEPDSATTQ